jgi:hypothetical protein
VPAPAIIPIVSDLPFKSSVAPSLTTTLALSLNAELEFKNNVPAETVSNALYNISADNLYPGQ